MKGSRTVQPPARLKGTDFEAYTLFAFDRAKKAGLCDAGRYGVQGTFHQGKWSPIKSLPDFEGALPGGRQFILDAKVCSGASLSLHASKVAERQLTHMLARASMGVPCCLLVHWSERQLKSQTQPAWTAAVPVHPALELWERWAYGSQKGISRKEAELYGLPVAWTVPVGAKKPAPDVLEAVRVIARRIDEGFGAGIVEHGVWESGAGSSAAA